MTDARHASGVFVLTTAPFAGFGNFFLPIHVGAETWRSADQT